VNDLKTTYVLGGAGAQIVRSPPDRSASKEIRFSTLDASKEQDPYYLNRVRYMEAQRQKDAKARMIYNRHMENIYLPSKQHLVQEAEQQVLRDNVRREQSEACLMRLNQLNHERKCEYRH
jgi:hypothetical protein